MKEEELLRAFGTINPEYVMEAEEERSGKHKGILKYAAMVASLVIILSGSYGVFRWIQNAGKSDLDYTMIATDDVGEYGETTTDEEKDSAKSEAAEENTLTMEFTTLFIDGMAYYYESEAMADELPEDTEYTGIVEGTCEEDAIPENGIYTTSSLEGAKVYQYGKKAVIILENRMYIFKNEKQQ